MCYKIRWHSRSDSVQVHRRTYIVQNVEVVLQEIRRPTTVRLFHSIHCIIILCNMLTYAQYVYIYFIPIWCITYIRICMHVCIYSMHA